MLKVIQPILNQAIIKELKTYPGQGKIWQIIEKNISGRILELPPNGILVIQNSSSPAIFLAGEVSEQGLKILTEILDKLDDYLLYCAIQYHPFFIKYKLNHHLRVEFLEHQFFQIKSLTENLEVSNLSFTIVNSEKHLLQCEALERYKFLYGNINEILKNAVIYIALIDDLVVSEVHLYIGGGFAEIDIVTNLKYRNKGYGSLLTQYVIKDCVENRKIKPIWCCNTLNKASLHTALKLGFIIDKYHICFRKIIPSYTK